jgi:type IV secretory pathway VirB9-like protein
MNFNELATKQNVLNALILKDGNNELGKELKVKIMRLRIAYKKARKQVDEDINEFTQDLLSEDVKAIQQKPEKERTSEEVAILEAAVNKANVEYKEFLSQKGLEEIPFSTNDSFTDEEFDELTDINVGNTVTVNEHEIKAEELLEAFYTLFVTE